MAQLAEGINGGLDVLVPLGGLEPPHLAPEASALSAELQGQGLQYNNATLRVQVGILGLDILRAYAYD